MASRGDVPRLFSKTQTSAEFQPSLHLVDTRKVQDKFKCKFSDGDFVAEVMVCGALAEMLGRGEVPPHALVKLTGWHVQTIAQKKGTGLEMCFAQSGEVKGVLPPENRVNARLLRKYPERVSSGMSQSVFGSQACTQEASQAFPAFPDSRAPTGEPHGAFTTPEKRGAGDTITVGAAAAPQFTPEPPPRPIFATPPQQAKDEAREIAAPPPWRDLTPQSAGIYGGATSSDPAPVQQQYFEQQRQNSAQPLAAQPPAFQPLAAQPPAFQPLAAQPQPVPQPAQAARQPATGARQAPGGGIGNYFAPRAPQAAVQGGALPGAAPGGVGSSAPKGDAGCVPVREITPYSQGQWRIKARVLAREGIRRFTNARGEGQLFKVELKDREGGEISATFFGRAVDRYYEVLRPGQVFYFSRGSAKAANRRFDRGDVVLTFDEGAIIDIAGEDVTIPGVQYEFRALEDVQSLDVGTTIDVKGVITDSRDPSSIIVRSTNKEKPKRDIVLWDGSGNGCFVESTVWGEAANEDWPVGAVVYLRSARVAEWNGKRSLNISGNQDLNPDDPPAFALAGAYEAAGRPRGSAGGGGPLRGPAGPRETLEECKEADVHLGAPLVPGQAFSNEGPKSVHRHLAHVTLTCVAPDKPPFYNACPELVERPNTQGPGAGQARACHKKMTLESHGKWTCASGHCVAQPLARYMCQRLQVLDHTGSMELSFFDEVGRHVFGADADTLSLLWDDPSTEAERDAFLRRAAWKRTTLRLRSTREVWNDEERIKITADEAIPVDLVKDGRRMLAEINAAVAGL